jgi:hypothetical protein
MGEFQCYKFKTIDRPLTDAERREVDELSSRGQVTSTSATFIYHYSDFRHKPETVLEKYFDAMLYFSNWGKRRLMFRLPADLVDEKAIKPYCYAEKYYCHIDLLRRGKNFILDIQFDQEEGDGWMEEDDYDLGDLTPLRDSILSGDYGALYLAWASFAQNDGEYDDEDFEDEVDDDDEPGDGKTPPVPPNMKRMSATLKAFARFFGIDDDLVSAAQALSPDSAAASLDYEKLLVQLPDKERIEWLVRLLKSEQRLDVQLRKRLEQFAPKGIAPKPVQATASELKSLTAQKGQERKEREAAEARERHVQRMKQLAPQEQALWKSVPFNLERQTGKSYDLATEALKDLKELAEYQGKSEAFMEKMLELRKEYFRRNAVISRWEKAGLIR